MPITIPVIWIVALILILLCVIIYLLNRIYKVLRAMAYPETYTEKQPEFHLTFNDLTDKRE